VVFAWIVWPDKATRGAAHARMQSITEMPFDGKRLIYGGFQMVVDA
jgi:uncharacterized protein YbaA (DUF1428 family)